MNRIQFYRISSFLALFFFFKKFSPRCVKILISGIFTFLMKMSKNLGENNWNQFGKMYLLFGIFWVGSDGLAIPFFRLLWNLSVFDVLDTYHWKYITLKSTLGIQRWVLPPNTYIENLISHLHTMIRTHDFDFWH